MEKLLGYRCSMCGTEYRVDEVKYTCPSDQANLDVVLNFSELREKVHPGKILDQTEQSIWRYLDLLPVSDPGGFGTPFRSAGYTPIFTPNDLRHQLGLGKLWIKDESRNPTASFKDRASALVVARAREIGAEVVVTASTGNAGAALAGMSAAIGQKAMIFAPRTAPPAKIAQLLVFNSQVILVDGTYDDAFDLTIQAAEQYGWYCRNTGYNPFTLEGKKTAAFEIWEYLHKTDEDLDSVSVLVSVGDGNIISGIHKGFKDLREMGWIETIPRIIGVQAEGSAAIANAFLSGTETITPVSAQTLADSISVDLPRDGVRAIRAARETGGAYITVTDAEILSAIAVLGKLGIFAEPAGATSYAGLVKGIHNRMIDPGSKVMIINTGSGLKDVKAAMQAVRQAPIIEPSLTALAKVLQ
jgi:threonine synthase